MIRLPGPPTSSSDVVTAADRVARASMNQAGRAPRLQAQMAAFVDKLRRAPSLDEAKRLWTVELEAIGDKALSTRVNYVSKYRTEIKAVLGEASPYLDVVRAPDDWVQQMQARQVAKVAAPRDLVPITRWREIVERSRDLLKSPDPLDIGVGLIVLTGRRPFEVFVQGQFSRVPLNQGGGRAFARWAVSFGGQAKTRGQEGTRAGEAYVIPSLAPATEIVEAVERLRQDPDAVSELTVAAGEVRPIPWAEMSSEDFKRAFLERGLLRDRLPEHFAELWPESGGLTAHSFRALYAEIAYEHFGKGKFTKNSFFAAVLGHTAKDLETSHAYMRFVVSEEGQEAAALQMGHDRREMLQRRIFDRFDEIGLLEIADLHGGDDGAPSQEWVQQLLAVTEAPAVAPGDPLEPEGPTADCGSSWDAGPSL